MDAKTTSALEMASTAELTKMIRQASDALDTAMHAPNCDYFAAHTESLRSNYFELFRRLMLRNPYSSIRKDVVSKMWFRTIYPPIEQYRANVKQFESMLNWSPSQQQQKQPRAPSGNADMDPIAVRRELSKWRARFQTFLQATSGLLLRLVGELAEVHGIVAAGSMIGLEAFAVDYRALSTHAHGFAFVDSLRTELHPALSTVQRAALAIISRLLTYLGDLSRYRILYTSRRQSVASMVHAVASGAPQHQAKASHDLWWPAKSFYRGAIQLAPHRGQPQNQLAVIHGYERNTLDGVFCYYRALTALHRFRPAEANLRTILDSAVRAIRAPSDPTPADGAGGGYQHYDARLYPSFTQLRFLFAVHQPSERELAQLAETGAAPARTLITAEMERELVGDIGAAGARFMQGVKSGSLDDGQVLMAQAIHVFELQQLSSLGAGDRETPLHDAAVARLSALLTMRVAESLCYALVASLGEGAQRARELKSEADLVSRAAGRGVAALTATLAWIVAAAARVARDSACREYLAQSGGAPVSPLRLLVFAAVRDSGLLRNAVRLRDAMDRASARVNRRAPPVAPPAWSDVLASPTALAQRLWGGEAARAQDAMLVGWQLPDGTVWGKPPQSQSQSQSPEPPQPQSPQSWWWQLHGLLSLVCECVPAVLAISGSSEGEDDDDETVCFQGRPRVQSQAAASPPPSSPPLAQTPAAASDDSQQSLPATPEVVAADFRPQAVSLPSTSPASPPPSRQDQPLLRNFTEPLLAQLGQPQARGGAAVVQQPGGDASGEWPRQAEAARLMMDRMALLSSSSAGGDESASYEQSVLALVDSEHDEVYSPAAATTTSSTLHHRAIGSQRAATANHQWPAFSQPSAPTTAPVSPNIHSGGPYHHPYNMAASMLSSPQTTAKSYPDPWSTTGASPSSSCSLDQAANNSSGWDALLAHSGYVANNYNSQQPQPQPQPSAAMDAWQQYQLEHQRKLALQQKLDQQQRIQMHLQQQLFVRQQQHLQQQWFMGQHHTPVMPSNHQYHGPADIYAAYNNMSPRMAADQPPRQPPPPLSGSLSNISNMSNLSSSSAAAAIGLSYPWAMAAGFSAGANPATSSVAALSSSSSASNIHGLLPQKQQQQTYEWCS
ncbi:hypothetical protein GGF42_000649 [Coemansia sp. RSA 2424]|nr:hypothetical protein GGF42_000649 [Coemansia sp. RSA 2424]